MELLFIYVMIYFGLFISIFFLITFFENPRYRTEKLKKFPYVSIVLPVWNEEKTIAATLKSVIALDYPKNKFEIIVVDDGSTDKTSQRVMRFKGSNIKIFKKKNGGKGSALNYGIKRSKGEFIVTLDADSFVDKDALKKMLVFFNNRKVMAVTSSMTIHKPKTFWQRLIHIEFLIGIFLRKTFAHVNSLYVVPGPFSVYKKRFFEKYGGFDENNLTEDTEMGMRIQSKGYIIENCIDAKVETITPKTFYGLLKQRRRWYKGFIDNVIKYKHLINRRYGYLGLLILPSAFISVGLGLAYIGYVIMKNIDPLKQSIEKLRELGFSALSPTNFEFSGFKEALFNFFINPLLPLAVIGFVLMILIIFSARKFGKDKYNPSIGLIYFFIFYTFVYTFWWGVAIIYKALNRKVVWV